MAGFGTQRIAYVSIVRYIFLGLNSSRCLLHGIGPEAVLLIHIDDVQGWSVPAGYKYRKDAPLYDLLELPKYAFMVLARLLSDLVARESKLRVVFSGTDYLVADALFHATEVSFKH